MVWWISSLFSRTGAKHVDNDSRFVTSPANSNFYFQPVHMVPPKGTSPETTAYVNLFKSIGLSQAKASEAAKNAKSAALLQGLIERHALTGGRIDEKQAGLVAALAVQGAKIGEGERGYVVNATIDGRLKSTDQMNGASLHPRSSRFPICWAHIEVYSCYQVPRDKSPSRGRRSV